MTIHHDFISQPMHLGLKCPKCAERLYIYTSTTTRYEYDPARQAEAIIYVDEHRCGGQGCGHVWRNERRGYYRVPGEVLDEMRKRIK